MVPPLTMLLVAIARQPQFATEVSSLGWTNSVLERSWRRIRSYLACHQRASTFMHV
jgi:hypothetical protein